MLLASQKTPPRIDLTATSRITDPPWLTVHRTTQNLRLRPTVAPRMRVSHRLGLQLHAHRTAHFGIDRLERCEKVQGISSHRLEPGFILKRVFRIDVGGKLLTNYLKELISYRQWNMMDQTSIMDDVKQKCCYVSADFRADMELSRYVPPSANPTPLPRVWPEPMVCSPLAWNHETIPSSFDTFSQTFLSVGLGDCSSQAKSSRMRHGRCWK